MARTKKTVEQRIADYDKTIESYREKIAALEEKKAELLTPAKDIIDAARRKGMTTAAIIAALGVEDEF